MVVNELARSIIECKPEGVRGSPELIWMHGVGDSVEKIWN